MKKLFIQNLGLIVTEKCNLKCRHCERGTCNNKDMSDAVVETTLGQLAGSTNVTLCGGEPTLALPVIEKIITYIVDNNIAVKNITTTINGVIYSEELLRLLDYFDDYVKTTDENTHGLIGVSNDIFHLDQAIGLGIRKEYEENLKRYSESKHFLEYRELNSALFNEGRATSVTHWDLTPIKQWPILISYPNVNKNLCLIGPLVTVNTDGIVTECDASFENQRTKYNYGNVLDDTIEDICLEHGKVMSLRRWNKKTDKIIKRLNS